jgi:hypothetical protein
VFSPVIVIVMDPLVVMRALRFELWT